MKCKNCGAHYKSRELNCPYCGTENHKGKLWKLELDRAQKSYEQKKAYIFSSMPLYVANKALNSICLFIGALAVLLFIAYHVGMGIDSLNTKRKQSSADITYMEQLHTNEEYDKLYEYLEEHEMFGGLGDDEESYGYRQAALLWEHSYRSFCQHRMLFAGYTEEKWKETTYHNIQSMLRVCHEMIQGDIGIYMEMDPVNVKLCEKLGKEAFAFLTTEFGFSKEEAERMKTVDDFGDEWDALINGVLERKGAKVNE